MNKMCKHEWRLARVVDGSSLINDIKGENRFALFYCIFCTLFLEKKEKWRSNEN